VANFPAKSLNSRIGKPSRFSAEKGRSMQSKLANSMMGVGAVGIFVGFITMLSSRGEHPDSTILSIGALAVSLGSLLAAAGMYVKAKYLQPSAPAAGIAGRAQPRRIRGGCDLCHGDVPLIHCRVHQVHMCADCTAQHFDPRSCTYIPSTRRLIQKPRRGTAARAGA
jgi:hypothetical protein